MTTLISYILRRIALGLTTVLAAMVIAFLLVRLTPGSPAQLILGMDASQAQINALNDKLGWNEPFAVQIGHYLNGVLHGNLGSSLIDGHSIGADLLARLPVTGSISLIATFIVSAIVGLALGLLSVVRGGLTDRVISTTNGIAMSLPSFWVAVILVFLLAVKLRWLPATGYVAPTSDFVGWLKSITLPVIALSIGGIALVARTARVGLIQALGQQHIQMLRSVGTPPWRLLLVHALRAASIPVVSVLGIVFVTIFTGTIVVEAFFGLPGLGQAASTAVSYHDFPAIEGVVIVSSFVVVLINLLVDLSVRILDPRVSH